MEPPSHDQRRCEELGMEARLELMEGTTPGDRLDEADLMEGFMSHSTTRRCRTSSAAAAMCSPTLTGSYSAKTPTYQTQ